MRTLEKTCIGRVLAPGPEVKVAMTRSSNDRVNASSQPASMAGQISGRVITRTTFNGWLPRR